jgi:hypothetical protein
VRTHYATPISLQSGPDDDFHVLSERIQKSNEPIGRKAGQLTPDQSGHFGLVDSKSVGRLRLRESLRGQKLANATCQLGFGPGLAGIRHPQIGEDVAAAGFDFSRRFIDHGSSLETSAIPHSGPPRLSAVGEFDPVPTSES